MTALVIVLSLFAVTIVAVVVGERIHLPYPILLLLTVGGLSFIPGVPELEIDPEIILPLFLPPLLFAMARRASWSVFRRRWRTLLVMAVVLTATTAVSVAGIVMLLVPGIAMPLAFALGAMIAPPDPVAVESVAEPAKLPRGLMRTLQTEGLFNDAVAIVVFTTAVSTLGGDASISSVFLRFVVGAVIAVLVGYAIGWLASAASRTIDNVAASGAVTIIVPFVAYLLAEEVHASGVIAVVVTALEINRRVDPEAARDRLMTASFWEIVDLLVTGTAFGLMGLELRAIVDEEGWAEIVEYLGIALIVVVVVVAVRFAATLLLRFIAIMQGGGRRIPRSWRDCLVITWCGMRGLATLALALSLPVFVRGERLADRELAVVVAAVVLMVTLVPTGLLLPWLIRTLKLEEDESVEAEEIAELVERAYHAANHALEVHIENLDASEREKDDLRAWSTRFRSRFLTEMRIGKPEGLSDTAVRQAKDHHDMLVGAQSVALEAARSEVLEARRDPMIDVAVVNQVLHRIDMRTVAIPPKRAASRPRKQVMHSGTSNLANWRGRKLKRRQ
ncbi:MAG: sodium:proton antiporter [Actinomycetaceae bacterium]|nr:sodium:proton antiporter [Actinomycetaceae bacterium]